MRRLLVLFFCVHVVLRAQPRKVLRPIRSDKVRPSKAVGVGMVESARMKPPKASNR